MKLTENFRDDLFGGLAAAVTALPLAIAFGVLAFAGLDDPDAASKGALAGLYGAIFTGFFASFLGGTSCQVTGPTAPMTTIIASVVMGLVAKDFSTPEVLTLTFCCIVLAGVWQVVFGLLKLGQLIKYIPYPVVAGFMNGIAVLIFMSQVKPLIGLTNKDPWSSLLDFSSYQIGTIFAGVVTIVVCILGPKLIKSIPGSLQALFTGSAAYYGFKFLSPDSVLGATIGAIPSAIPTPHQLDDFFTVVLPNAATYLPLILPPAFALGVLGAIDSLLTSVVADTVTRTKHNSRQELIGQGVGNMVSGAFGGLAGAGATVRTLVNVQAGGRGKASGMMHSVILLLVVVVAGKIAGMIPMVVLAGILLVTAVKMVDTWSSTLVVKVMGTPAERRTILLNLAVVAVVALVTVTVDLMVAVGIGLVMSAFLFTFKMTKSPIYRLTHLREQLSRRVLPSRIFELLKKAEESTLVIELHAALFFGTADLLSKALDEAITDRTKRVLLDFRRVTEVDSSGARLLILIQERLSDSGIELALSSLGQDSPKRRFLSDMGVLQLVTDDYVFLDLDHALEWAEDQVLMEQEATKSVLGHRLELSELELFHEISLDDIASVSSLFELSVRKQEEVVFSPGDEATGFFVVASGRLSRRASLEDRSRRLASFWPGTVMGEMELFGKLPRTGYLVCDTDSEVYHLSAENMQIMKSEHPRVACLFLTNVATELAGRLYQSLDEIRILE